MDKDDTEDFHDHGIKIGYKFAHPPPDEEVVISGLAGQFPDSENVYEFQNNLFNKVDMVSDDTRRWKPVHDEIPQRTGKLKNISNFDAGGFGVHQRHADHTEPMVRLITEKAFECVMDAGINPSELEGTRTGVFVGACAAEGEKLLFYTKLVSNAGNVVGTLRSMIAQHVNYHLKLNSKSFTCDTACSSSMYALEMAYKQIRMGKCDQAIVAGCNLCLLSNISLQFSRLGMLSLDGTCKAFDNDANGYVRAESVCAIFLQKKKHAKRVYARIVHVKANCDGYKTEGITYPSGMVQKTLLEEFYKECDIPPNEISFVEAHGTGTIVGDPEEALAIDEIYCKNRKDPLLIGTVKSNIGHSEPVSGLCAITKVIVAFETGYIPPNINFKTPRKDIDALQKGRIKVIAEKTKWEKENGLAAINNFGFGGANCHALLQRHKEKKRRTRPLHDLPRLVYVSGRTESSVTCILDDLKNRKIDDEYIRLYHDIFSKELCNEIYRGYSILNKNGEIHRSVATISEKQPLCFVFGDVSKLWVKTGKDLLSIAPFQNTLKRIAKIINTMDKMHLLYLIECYYQGNTMQTILASVAIQIGLLDLMEKINIIPDHVTGIATGELLCAYYEKQLTLEEVVKATYYIGLLKTNHYSNLRKSDQQIVQQLAKLLPSNGLQATKNIGYENQNNNLTYKEYLISATLAPHDLEQKYKLLPKDSIVLYFGDQEKTCNHSNLINLVDNNADDCVRDFMNTLGRLFINGINFNVASLYPDIKFPVSRSTPMISPLIKWDHRQDFLVLKQDTVTAYHVSIFVIDIRATEWAHLKGHVIDGRNIVPATAYLFLVWQFFAELCNTSYQHLNVGFEDVKFHRATYLTSMGSETAVTLSASIRKKGYFELNDGNVLVVSGRIYQIPNDVNELVDIDIDGNSETDNLKPLLEKDVYKELRLRGYNYSDGFRSIQECNNAATKGILKWRDNWIMFMDTMLQIKILQEDNRHLFVPTDIHKLVIYPEKHLAEVKNKDTIDVRIQKDADIVRSGGIQITGIGVNVMTRRKPTAEPVLESYQFVPNEGKLPLDQCIRVNMQIILENTLELKFKLVEIGDSQYRKNKEPICTNIMQVLGDQPLVKADIKLLVKETLDFPGITVEDKDLKTESNCLLVVGVELLDSQILVDAVQVIKENGYIISREDASFETNKKYPDLEILTTYKTENETIIMLRKTSDYKKPTLLDISNLHNFEVMSNIQQLLKADSNIVLVAKNDPYSGILGFVNCLRREKGTTIRCMFIFDDLPETAITEEFYENHLKKGMAINVLRHSQWGTYRHLLADLLTDKECENGYLTSVTPGDLSSLKWIEGPSLNHYSPEQVQMIVNISHATLNFKDVLIVSGRLPPFFGVTSRVTREGIVGIEFAGIDARGKRIFGITDRGGLATIVTARPHLVWEVPDKWTMEDAATVPVIYITVLFAFHTMGGLRRGQTILIHAGSGGIGQAAINIALHCGCVVFTTVGTEKKKEFILKTFPQIKEDHIGNSRNTSFEQMIYDQTKGRGVDIVLNSLAEEKLFASVRCLARNGHFLEIGKFDLLNDSKLNISIFEKEAKFNGIMLDRLFISESAHKLHEILLEGIKSGAVKPIYRHVYKYNEIEEAFRFMAGGKHIGKIVIEMKPTQQEKNDIPGKALIYCKPKFYCNPSSTYIIVGGLGGFGMELADWLVVKGCRNLVLVSRNGIKNGFQELRIRFWKTYLKSIYISLDDVTTREGCEKLLKQANKLGPVSGIFNLAVVLKDEAFENQNAETFQVSLGPKATATKYLDEISRIECPDLSYFVVFSSVVCGRGNISQTNYGMSNSIMERICEQRRKDNLPALAIQWGAFSDVGLVADMSELNKEVVIGGTLPQKITSCLDVMDEFLCRDEVILSSMVVAEKRVGGNVEEIICNILGIKNMKTINMQASLPELGMDSITGLEIKQLIEREYEVVLTPQDMKTMTFLRLREISENKSGLTNETHLDINVLLKRMDQSQLSNIPVIELKTAKGSEPDLPKVYFLPGIEGMGYILEPLTSKLLCQAFCAQFLFTYPNDNIEGLTQAIIPHMDLSKPTFTLIAYSYGCVVAVELVAYMERNGCLGSIILIDGSPHYMKTGIDKSFDSENEENFKTSLLLSIVSVYGSFEMAKDLQTVLLKCNTFEEKEQKAVDILATNKDTSSEYIKDMFYTIYHRLKSVKMYKPSFPKLKSKARLFKPSNSWNAGADYGLSELFEDPVIIKTVDADHVTILQNKEMINDINNLITLKEENNNTV